MPRKSDPVETRLELLRTQCADAGSDEILKLSKKALRDAHPLLVAQAAKYCEEHLFESLEKDLIKAYKRFLTNPAKKDPKCRAKGAITRALLAMNCQDIDFFIEGLSYSQLEPVWGGSVDTAIEVRVNCAMGLAGASYHRAPVELAPLLDDPEDQVRIGAIRAMAITQPIAAETILRFKAILGDANPDVTSEALVGLLQLSPHESKEFVSGFFHDDMDPLLRESLALALGESKVHEALEILQECWDNEPFKREQDLVMIRGAVLHRSEEAFEWLLDIVYDGDFKSAQFVIEELLIYSGNEQLVEQMQSALADRGDDALTALFTKRWL